MATVDLSKSKTLARQCAGAPSVVDLWHRAPGAFSAETAEPFACHGTTTDGRARGLVLRHHAGSSSLDALELATR